MHISGNEYCFELEQWSKVVVVGSDLANPDSWIENLPNGTVRLYGSTQVISQLLCVVPQSPNCSYLGLQSIGWRGGFQLRAFGIRIIFWRWIWLGMARLIWYVIILTQYNTMFLKSIDLYGSYQVHIVTDGVHHTDTITVLLSTENGYKPQDPIKFKPEVLNGKYYSGDFQVILAMFLGLSTPLLMCLYREIERLALFTSTKAARLSAWSSSPTMAGPSHHCQPSMVRSR